MQTGEELQQSHLKTGAGNDTGQRPLKAIVETKGFAERMEYRWRDNPQEDPAYDFYDFQIRFDPAHQSPADPVPDQPGIIVRKSLSWRNQRAGPLPVNSR
jgi:hypothetical protein